MATEPRPGRRATEWVAITGAGIACLGAVVSALVPTIYNYSTQNRELDIKLIKIGVGILGSDPKASPVNGARDWAIEIVERYSGVPFSGEAKRQLQQNRLPAAPASTPCHFDVSLSQWVCPAAPP
jgi:hypothetical protein